MVDLGLERKQVHVLGGLGLMAIFLMIQMTLVPPIFPIYAKSLTPKLTTMEISWTFSVFSFSQLAACALMGIFGHRIGSRRMVFLGIIVECAASISFGYSNTLWEFVLFRILWGTGSGMTYTGQYLLMSSYLKDKLAFANGTVELFTAIGTIFGPLIGPALYGKFEFGTPFLIVGISVVVLLIPAMMLLIPADVSMNPLVRCWKGIFGSDSGPSRFGGEGKGYSRARSSSDPDVFAIKDGEGIGQGQPSSQSHADHDGDEDRDRDGKHERGVMFEEETIVRPRTHSRASSAGRTSFESLPLLGLGAPGAPKIEPTTDEENKSASEVAREMWREFIDFLSVLMTPSVLVASLTVLMVSMMLNLYMPTLSIHMKEKYNLDPMGIGLLFLLAATVFCFTAPVLGILCDRLFQRKAVGFVGYMLVATGYILLGPQPGLIPGDKLSVVFFDIWIGVFGLAMACALIPAFPDLLTSVRVAKGLPRDADDDEDLSVTESVAGPVSGAYTSLYSLGEIIAPILGASLKDAVGSIEWSYSVFGYVLIGVATLIVLPVSIWEFVKSRGLSAESSTRAERV